MGFLKGFVSFLRTQGVIGLAIGFILGAQVSKLVSALVNDLVTPVVGAALGKAGDFASSTATVGGVVFKYGDFISNLIDFIIVAAVVYFGVMGIGLDKIDQKDGK